MSHEDREEKIELYLQGEALTDIQVLEVAPTLTVAELFDVIRADGNELTDEHVLLIEDDATEHSGVVRLIDIGIGHQGRIHCHRCRKVEVSVHFNNETERHSFPPSATMAAVTKWATDKFKLEGRDACEHALQVCNSTKRPDEDSHLGALVAYPNCTICFDLVPKVRVEG